MRKGYRTTEVSNLIGALPLTNFQQSLIDVAESSYASNKLYPLGKRRQPDIPPEAVGSTFGFISRKGDSASTLIRPSNSFVKVSRYHEDYDISRKSESIGAPAGIKYQRNYDQAKEIFNSFVDGKRTKILPLGPDSKSPYRPPITKTLEKNDSQFIEKDDSSGHVDPVKVTSKHYKNEQSVIEVFWNLLKMKNHCNFHDFSTAFKAYDQKNVGKISAEDIQAMCIKFGICVPIQVIQKLVSKCDILDKDGMINYSEFVHCLNWKDLLPEKPGQKIEKYANCWREGINNPPQSILDRYKTVSSNIGDYYHKVLPKTAGIPTLRTDKPTPRLQKVADFSDYGDVSNASGVIQPNVYAEHGVYEQDLAKLCSKQEIMNLLKKCGYVVKKEILDDVWKSKSNRPTLGAALHSLKQKCF